MKLGSGKCLSMGAEENRGLSIKLEEGETQSLFCLTAV